MLEGLLFIVLLSLAGQGRALFQYIGQRLAVTAICGVLSAVGYGTVLWAMTQAPIALVSATRETSVLFAALIGVWFMRERLTARQWSGAFIIVLGLVALRL
jgi:drug/metabolite transporter (DMT)-like permease